MSASYENFCCSMTITNEDDDDYHDDDYHNHSLTSSRQSNKVFTSLTDSKTKVVYSWTRDFCPRKLLACGLVFGLVVQIVGTVAVLGFHDDNDSDESSSSLSWFAGFFTLYDNTRSSSRYPTREEWNGIVNCFSLVVYTINILFTISFIVGIISRMIPKSKKKNNDIMNFFEGDNDKVEKTTTMTNKVFQVCLVTMTVLWMVSLGVGLSMFLVTAILLPRILNMMQLPIFFMLQLSYFTLIGLLRLFDILLTAMECAEASEEDNEDGNHKYKTEKECNEDEDDDEDEEMAIVIHAEYALVL